MTVSATEDRVRIPRIPRRTEKIDRRDFWGRVIVPLNQTRNLIMGRQEGNHRWVLKENELTRPVFDFERIKASHAFVLVETGAERSYVLTGSDPTDMADELFRHR